jgi:hypothetical protein
MFGTRSLTSARIPLYSHGNRQFDSLRAASVAQVIDSTRPPIVEVRDERARGTPKSAAQQWTDWGVNARNSVLIS